MRGVSLASLQKRHRRMPADAVFSGRTAAWLHGLDFAPCDPIEVTLPRLSTTSRLARTKITRSDFLDTEVCDRHGLPVTSATRTVVDLARRGPLPDAVVAVELALRAGVVRLEDVREWARSHPRHRGLGFVVTALELADPRSESPMETRLRLLLVLSGLPRPEVQLPIDDQDGRLLARPDFVYPERRLAVEYDGRVHRTSLAADNRRQNRLIEAGYRVLRFTAADILHSPAAVVAQVERALAYSIGSPN